MNQEERNVWAGIIANLAVVGYFGRSLWMRMSAGEFAGPDGLINWAKAVLWIIPIGIVVTIAITIVFTIGYSIVTQDENPDTGSDERDQMIGLFGTRVTLVVAAAGFILSLFALANGWSAIAGLSVILLFMALSDLFGNIAKLLRYRGVC